jgi:hypothetical protein
MSSLGERIDALAPHVISTRRHVRLCSIELEPRVYPHSLFGVVVRREDMRGGVFGQDWTELAKSPEDLEAARRAAWAFAVRSCRHAEPMIVVLRWITVMLGGLLVIVLAAGVLDVFYFAGTREQPEIVHAMFVAMTSGGALVSTTWLLSWRLQREVLATTRELIAVATAAASAETQAVPPPPEA